MNKIYLGGTRNNSIWRDELIPFLERNKIEYFNPVVNSKEKEKDICNIHLYVITKEQNRVYDFVEAYESTCHNNKIVIFKIISKDMPKKKLQDIKKVAELISYRGGIIVSSYHKLYDIILKATR